MSSLVVGALYTVTMLYSVECIPQQYRLNSYLLYSLSRNIAFTLLPLILERSPFNGDTNSWRNISVAAVVIYILGIIVGVLFGEPYQSAKVRERTDGKSVWQSKYAVFSIKNDDIIEPEPMFGLYVDMFFAGGKVVAALLIILFYFGSLLTTVINLSFPMLSTSGSSCSFLVDPIPCTTPITVNQMMTTLGTSLFASTVGYIFIQRYGRKNTYRGPCALRVGVVICMVLCAGTNFLLAQIGAIVVFSTIMEFTLNVYSLELYSIRSRATALGLLTAFNTLGILTAFFIDPFLLKHVEPNLKFSVLTVLGSLVFGSSLGLRKDTHYMAININDATLDIGL